MSAVHYYYFTFVSSIQIQLSGRGVLVILLTFHKTKPNKAYRECSYVQLQDIRGSNLITGLNLLLRCMQTSLVTLRFRKGWRLSDNISICLIFIKGQYWSTEETFQRDNEIKELAAVKGIKPRVVIYRAQKEMPQ